MSQIDFFRSTTQQTPEVESKSTLTPNQQKALRITGIAAMALGALVLCAVVAVTVGSGLALSFFAIPFSAVLGTVIGGLALGVLLLTGGGISFAISSAQTQSSPEALELKEIKDVV